MRIVVSGSAGLIGSALVKSLTTHGHAVTRLVRDKREAGGDAVLWDPASGTVDKGGLEGHDAVVHLAGRNIASERWTPAVKAGLRESRVGGTKLLSTALGELDSPPKVLAVASAIGYYGNRGEAVIREDGSPGSGFLANLCREWEAAATPARQKGIRVVNLRIGVVLSPDGGALAKMLVPFQLGLGGPIGSGAQYMSWIVLDDVAVAIELLLSQDDIEGPVNLVAPHAVTNMQFTKALGKVLARPTIFPVPAFGARLAFGEMADELLLASTRVEPAKLLAAGYQFHYPEIEGALRHVLAKSQVESGDRLQ